MFSSPVTDVENKKAMDFHPWPSGNVLSLCYFLKTTGEGRTPRRRARPNRHKGRFISSNALLLSVIFIFPQKSVKHIDEPAGIVNLYFLLYQQFR
jgi:hypothetical protein